MIRWIRNHRVLAAIIALSVMAAVFLGCEGDYGRPKGFLTINSLNRPDCRLGVFEGTGPAAVAHRLFPNAEIVVFDDVSEAGASLLGGRLEGFIGAESVLNVICRRYPYRFRVMDDALERQPTRVLLAQKNEALLNAINAFIVEYKCSGVYDDMFLRWCLADEFVPMPEIPEAENATEVLHVGTSGLIEPMSYIDENGHLTGYDIEFALRLGRALGRRVRFHLDPTRSQYGLLKEGKIDVIIDNFNAPDVKPGLVASDGYLDADTKVLIDEVQPGLEEHLDELMLEGTQFGVADALIGDLRARLFVNGFVNTASITLLATFFGFWLARLIGRLERLSPRIVQRAIEGLVIAIRWTPPLLILLLFYCAILTGARPWTTAVVALAVWFAAYLEPVAGSDPLVWLPVMRLRLPVLLQWTCVVGYINVFDLTMAVDLVCGRTFNAFVPVVAVAAAYGVVGWLLDRGISWYEGRVKRK